MKKIQKLQLFLEWSLKMAAEKFKKIQNFGNKGT